MEPLVVELVLDEPESEVEVRGPLVACWAWALPSSTKVAAAATPDTPLALGIVSLPNPKPRSDTR